MNELTLLLFQILIVIGPMALGVGIVYYVSNQRRKRSRYPLQSLTRIPGHRLFQQITDEIINLSLFLSGLVGSVSIPLAMTKLSELFGAEPINLWIILTLCMTIIIYCARGLYAAVISLTNLRVGLQAELAVGQSLNELLRSNYTVFHDVPCESFNIDHVIVGNNGIFAVETKGRSKQNRFRDNHKVRFEDNAFFFPQGKDSGIVNQACRQANWLSKWLSNATGESCVSIPAVCIPGWFIELKSKPPFPISNSSQLSKTIEKWSGPKLSKDQIKRVNHQIFERCRTATGPTNGID